MTHASPCRRRPVLLALVRISGVRLSSERLPVGDDKARLLRAIASAHPVLSLVLILRIVGETVKVAKVPE